MDAKIHADVEAQVKDLPLGFIFGLLIGIAFVCIAVVVILNGAS